MTGKEFATLRKQLGYTQGALAQALQVSTPTVSRLEEKEVVPGEHVKVLLNLPPVTGSGRGPYKAEKAASSRKPAGTPQPQRRARLPQAESREAAPASPAQLVEVVHEADAIGAVEIGAVWLASCLLLGIYRHLEQQALEEEMEDAFARFFVRTPQPHKPKPPPLPKHGRVRCCWRCGVWL